MQEETEVEPKVEEIVFDGRLLTSLEDVKQKLSNVPYYALQTRLDGLEIIRVESRNIHKKPFLFSIIVIKQDSLDLVYSVLPGSSENLRRATVIRNLASVMSMIKDSFQIDQGKFFQYIDSTIDGLLSSLSQSYSALFNKYDSLINEYAEMKRVVTEMQVSNRNLTLQSSQINEENKALIEQVKSLQTYSDESLMAMVQDWIEVHNNSIDIVEFSKTYKVSEPRVEQVLDKMVSMGYIELKS